MKCSRCGAKPVRVAVSVPVICGACYQRDRKRPDWTPNGRTRTYTREYLAARTNKVGTCWIWPTPDSRTGYGPHRRVYEALVGPIPAGLQLDHLCHTADPSCPGSTECPHRACVNPDHLEPVTAKENAMRSPRTLAFLNGAKTHCPKGHEYTPENTYLYVYPNTRNRACRTCKNNV